MTDSFKGRIVVHLEDDGKDYFLKGETLDNVSLVPVTEYDPILPTDIRYRGCKDDNDIYYIEPIINSK